MKKKSVYHSDRVKMVRKSVSPPGASPGLIQPSSDSLVPKLVLVSYNSEAIMEMPCENLAEAFSKIKEQKTEKGEIYWSSISIFTYDCIKKLQQVERVRYTGRMGEGKRLEDDFFKSDWEKVAAGTPNDNYMVRACAGGD